MKKEQKGKEREEKRINKEGREIKKVEAKKENGKKRKERGRGADNNFSHSLSVFKNMSSLNFILAKNVFLKCEIWN